MLTLLLVSYTCWEEKEQSVLSLPSLSGSSTTVSYWRHLQLEQVRINKHVCITLMWLNASLNLSLIIWGGCVYTCTHVLLIVCT